MLNMILLDACTCDCFFHRDVRCLFEVGIFNTRSCLRRSVYCVHALSILNFDVFRLREGVVFVIRM